METFCTHISESRSFLEQNGRAYGTCGYCPPIARSVAWPCYHHTQRALREAPVVVRGLPISSETASSLRLSLADSITLELDLELAAECPRTSAITVCYARLIGPEINVAHCMVAGRTARATFMTPLRRPGRYMLEVSVAETCTTKGDAETLSRVPGSPFHVELVGEPHVEDHLPLCRTSLMPGRYIQVDSDMR